MILQAPGVAQDSYGQLHVRDEHANLKFRIDDVLIPEGITGFGQEIDTHLVKTVDLITGSLPAEFGFRTSGIIDIHTRRRHLKWWRLVLLWRFQRHHISKFPILGVRKAASAITHSPATSRTILGSKIQPAVTTPSTIGLSSNKGFANFSYLIDDSSRINLLLSGTYSDFQIPANPGQTPLFALAGASPKNFDSRFLSENQYEQNDFAILAYQKSFENVSLQVAAFSRYSSTLFTPDDAGDHAV